VQELFKVLAAYEAREHELKPETLAAMDAIKREADIEFLREDMANLLAESMEGMQRVKRIVQDLKDFSHVDEAEKQWANLELGLDSTLNMARNEIKYKAAVVKDYAVVDTIAAVSALADEIRRAGRVALHVVADGDAGMRAGLAGLVVATSARQARFLPFSEATLVSDAGLDRSAALAALKAVLEDAAIAKVGHDLKFAAVILGRHDIALAGVDLDTMIAAYLLDASRSSQDLEPVALEQLGYKALTADQVRGKGAKAVSFGTLPPAALLDYAGERADLSWQLGERFAPELDRVGVARVYRDLELPLTSTPPGAIVAFPSLVRS